MPRLVLCAALLVASIPAALALPEGWTDDWAQAQRRAKDEGKGLLLNFTGSDWCGYCIKLHEEVFGQAEFTAYAAKAWVLVYVDFPQNSKARDPAQNETLKERFKIEGFPTIVLLDRDGTALGQTGYRGGGPAAYVKHLEAFKAYPRLKAAFAEALAKAADEAAKRAVALELCQAAQAVDKIVEVAEHLTLADPTNEHGLHTALATAEAYVKLEADQAKDALARLAAFETRFPNGPGEGELAQQFHIARGTAYEALGETANEIAAYKKALKAAPKSDQAADLEEWIEEKETALREEKEKGGKSD